MTAALMLLALVACTASGDDSTTSTKDGTPNGTTDTDTTYEPPPPWTPETGAYVVTTETELKNTCGDLSNEGGKPSSNLQIEVASDASAFTLVGDDPVDTGSATTTTNCPLTQVLDPDVHYPFDCDDVEATLNLSEFSLEGMIRFSVDIAGTWTTPTHFDATNTGTVTCKGPDCDLVSEFLEVPFPCSVISSSAVDKAP